LRLTSLRLGQLQEKKDSQATIMRRDIATLLQQRNIGMARAKAQKLFRDDAMGDLVEILEMHVGFILEHFSEVDRDLSPSPGVVEAASTIIYAAPQVDSKDLNDVRNLLVQRLGPDFSRSASGNHNNHVSLRVLQAISAPPPSAAALDVYLEEIARMFNVKWSPEPRRYDLVNAMSEILDPDTSNIVDLVRLRELCSRGIPDMPAWLRPRIWKLFFGTLPALKSLWKNETHKQRESYYDLIHRLLDPFSDLPPPSIPLSLPDVTLLRVSEQLSSIPPMVLSSLNKVSGPLDCPLDDRVSDREILSARNLNIRLKLLQGLKSEGLLLAQIPEILLESDINRMPKISLSSPDFGPSEDHSGTTLLSSAMESIPHYHSTALLRLLYLHTSINPGNRSPHIPALLIPIYAVLNQEVEAVDLAHAEADTFWLFEAMVGEFSELEDDEGGSTWMKKFSERLSWADIDLSENLQIKGLDPKLPHYSYNWLAPLLTQTLPLDSVYVVWDALFSRQPRDRDANPKLDYLLDICTAMLIHARVALFRLGKGNLKLPSLWDEENSIIPRPLHAWELGEAFAEGVSLLQKYPLESVGGIDGVLQTAFDLCRQREEEVKLEKNDKVGLGARLKVTIWKGFTNQVSSPIPSPTGSSESSDEAHDNGDETETQTSMEVPPSPIWPRSQTPSRSPSPIPTASPLTVSPQERQRSSISGGIGPSGLWAYAEKLKDSDTAATIAKVSSNWRAKTLVGTWGRSNVSRQQANVDTPLKHFRQESLGQGYRNSPKDIRHGSLIFPQNTALSPTSSEPTPAPNSTFMKRTANTQLSLLTRTKSAQPIAKAGPRPLLLSASSVITSPPGHTTSQIAKSVAVPDRGEWADVLRLKKHTLHNNSQSSISSLSPSDALGRPSKSGWDSDNSGSGRVVPLNRRSVSPMAPGFRVHQGRPTSGSSSAASSDRGLRSPPFGEVPRHNHIHMADSSPLASPIHPQTPSMDISHADNLQLIASEHQSPLLIHPDTLHLKKSIRKRTPPPSLVDETSDSSAAEIVTRSPRLRSKRYQNRPPNLNMPDTPNRLPIMERTLSNLNTLAVDWPNDDQDVVITPRASTFNDELSYSPPHMPRSPRRSRKTSAENPERFRRPSSDHDTRLRKNSASQRIRKVSGDKGSEKKARESSADEGDDEGYDELLSAYESEEGLKLR
ncbi:regulator of Vps4 activity in the MVB pathway-domain-containing protein, partial [Collybia nuda]